MPNSQPKKSKVWVPVIVSLILLLGFGLGVITQKYLVNTKPLDKFLDRDDPIDEIISLVDIEYVDSVSRDSLYLEAVNGILKNLDPHTVYIPANQLAQANSILEGTGKGIGIEYFFLQDTMLVTAITVNSPAAKSGLKIGDRLLKVNGKGISGINIKEEDAVKYFSESDTLALLVVHPNENKTNNIRLIKGNIASNSIAYKELLKDNRTGYIKISIFSANSYNETVDAIESLKDEGMTQLILDLRDNGGGYLEEATNIADELIDGDKLLLSVNGKRDGRNDYNAANKGVFEEGRLIILIDQNSASASEILAGAVQDWDRGVIIGTNSYGKGLVQEQFDLSDGSALRLTVGRYFTPSGRSIQRSYAKGKTAYTEAYYNRINNGSQMPSDPSKIFYTLKNHRAIYGSGGIFPDILINNGLKTSSSELQYMIDNYVLDTYINTYYFTTFKQQYLFDNYSAFEEGFNVNDELLNKMKEYFIRQDAIFTDRIWKNPNDMAYLRLKSKAMIAKLEYGVTGYFKVLLHHDEVLTKAKEIISSPTYNTILIKESI